MKNLLVILCLSFSSVTFADQIVLVTGDKAKFIFENLDEVIMPGAGHETVSTFYKRSDNEICTETIRTIFIGSDETAKTLTPSYRCQLSNVPLVDNKLEVSFKGLTAKSMYKNLKVIPSPGIGHETVRVYTKTLNDIFCEKIESGLFLSRPIVVGEVLHNCTIDVTPSK